MADAEPHADDPPVKCFYSHKCGESEHAFGNVVRRVFCRRGIELLVDPFGVGVEVGSRIETVEFHALLFVSSKESNESPYCQAELKVASSRLVPVFIIRWKDEVPECLRGRIYLDYAEVIADLMETKLDELAQAIRLRGALLRDIGRIGPENPPEVARRAARRIADTTDTTALAEFLDLMERRFSPGIDPVAGYNVVVAVGETRALRAEKTLRAWCDMEIHPLVKEGIREALEMIGCKA